MGRRIALGIQDFGKLIKNNYFFIDKTRFIKEWWENGDDVTIITRPRRFGKTLNMSMLDYFFSMTHLEDQELFQGLAIWNEEQYQNIQGTYPVISMTFADVKKTTFRDTYNVICGIIYQLYEQSSYILEGDRLAQDKKKHFRRIKEILADEELSGTMQSSVMVEKALKYLSEFLFSYHNKKVILLLDEYDTPLQEAYLHGYWEEMVNFTRSLFNSTFKTNSNMERSLLTGITRISKESIFSDLNNPAVITTTSSEYADSFGFTEDEVFSAMEEMGDTDRASVKKWYDGFCFGNKAEIYNPWSIISYLKSGKIGIYWANTSSNGLIDRLLSKGTNKIKMEFETLLAGRGIVTSMDEQIVFDQLDQQNNAVWSLLVASGYLKVTSFEGYINQAGDSNWEPKYTLEITNLETRYIFMNMVNNWFQYVEDDYNDFIKAMFSGDVESMNDYMNCVALDSFSFFDSGAKSSEKAPERFYHGFVLGLLVKTADRYMMKSNRESGLGRYDVMLIPKDKHDFGYILEFKVLHPNKEKSLEETAHAALRQIDEKQYERELIQSGVSQIRKYGFAFKGKQVLIVGR